MAATAAQIAQVRRMVAEPTTGTYSDVMLASYIESYPLIDADGHEPSETDWTATYDLHAAAADVWEEKAAGVADSVDFGADGANYHLSQKYEQAMARVRYHRARRSPTTHTLVKWPEERNSAELYPWIGNLPEPDD